MTILSISKDIYEPIFGSCCVLLYPCEPVCTAWSSTDTIAHASCSRQHDVSTPLTLEEWVSVLKLSTIYGFHSVRATTIENLTSFAADDPILKVVVAKKYDVPNWLATGLNALAQRDEPLGFPDFERLQDIGDTTYVIDFLLRIAHIGESYSAPTANQGTAMLQYAVA
jgi:hypothetical protein